MKYLNKLLFIFILLPFFSSAQSNYQPGYIVNLKGDTIWGVIDYREWNKNPNNINFKSNNHSHDEENFTTKNIRAFAISNREYYDRYVLSISQDAMDIDKLSSKVDSSYLTDTVFLRLDTKGKYLNLYSYTDNIKPRFYILETGQTQPQELAYHAFYRLGVPVSIQYVTRYRIQLENLAHKYNADTNTEQGRILGSAYRESELIRIVQAINGTSSVQFTPQATSGIRWFTGIGVNYSTVNFHGTGTELSGNFNSVFPKITAGLDFIVNKNIQSIILRTDYSFTVNKFNASSSNNNIYTPMTSTLNFAQYNSSITPQIIFNMYNSEKLKIFIDIGASLNLTIYNHYQYVTTNDSFAPDIQNNFPDLQRLWVSFPIKAGVAVNKRIEINVCYVPSSQLTNTTFSGAITSYQAGINYLFDN